MMSLGDHCGGADGGDEDVVGAAGSGVRIRAECTAPTPRVDHRHARARRRRRRQPARRRSIHRPTPRWTPRGGRRQVRRRFSDRRARLPVLTASLAARGLRRRARANEWASRVGTSRGEHDHVPSDHSTTSSSSLAAAATTRPAASEGAREPPRPRRLHRSAAVFAAVRAVQRGDAGVVAHTPESGFRHDHQHAPRGRLANRARALHQSPTRRRIWIWIWDFVADGGGARGSDAASSRASAPNQRTEPALSTARTPPPSTAPAGTSAERPSGRRVDPPTTALSRDARGSASVQDTSAGSPEPGGASAAKYRPQTGSYVAGDAKVWPRPTAQLRARVCEG